MSVLEALPEPEETVGMTPIQAKTARQALGLSYRQAFELSGVSVSSIQRIEAGEGVVPVVKATTIDRLRKAYEMAGVVFHRDGRTIRVTRR